MDQYIGRMLDGRYEILERIGTGGMAVVYKTRDQRLNRLVAVKVLKPDLAQDEDFRRRFNAESQAVAQLSHPNIVSVYDVSRGGDTEYIVMELIDGITLKQYGGNPCISSPRSCGGSATPTAGASSTGISSLRTSWSSGTAA